MTVQILLSLAAIAMPWFSVRTIWFMVWTLGAAGLVLVIGHGMNFVLSLMSATVHGLRLNVIEFFNWGLNEEGRPFRAYERKETGPWKRSS